MKKKAAITGVGMIGAIGHDVETACAALRCGIRRFGETSHTTLDPMTLEDIPVPASALTGISDGYQGVGLYARIGYHALEDLLRYAKINKDDKAFWSKTRIVLCVSPTRENELTTPEIDFNKALDRIVELSGVGIPAQNRFINENGHAAVLFAIEQVLQDMGQNKLDRALILGVDSLVGKEELLFYLDRLKSDEAAEGFSPGEAGAALLIEDETSARKRNALVEGFITAVFTHQAEKGRSSEENDLGAGLAGVVAKSLGVLSGVSSYYCDLNGEKQRAQEWGYAIPKIKMHTDHFPETILAPAESLGDTGAASGAVAICAAIRSFVGNYNQGNDILVWSSSDSGQVASAIVQMNAQGALP